MNQPNDAERRNDAPLNVMEMCTQFGVGGITRHVLGLRDWLTAHGHTVSLAGSADAWANPQTDMEFLDLPTRLVSGAGGGMATRLLSLAKASLRLRAALKRNPVDLIHAHESAPALVAQIAAKGLGIPLAVTYHGSEPDRIASFGRIARGCDLVITPSHHSAADLADIGGVPRDKLMVLGLGVKPPAPVEQAEVDALRGELLDGADKLVVTIARMVEQKGIDILIDCVVRLKETNPNTRFVVAGDGPEEDRYRRLAEERGVTSHLKFIGRTNQPHLYLRSADMFLLTSRWEALPFTIAEAFQAGTPVVAAACSGVVELVDDSVGRVVPIGDVDAICATVSSLLRDDDGLHAMGERAFERSKEDRFDPDYIHRQFEKTYFDLRSRA